MRADNRDTTLQRFRKYSSSIEVEPAGFREEKRRRTWAFSAVPTRFARDRVFVRRFSWEISAGSPELFREHVDGPSELLVVCDELVDLLYRVHHRGVVFVVEQLTDIRVGEISQMFA